MSGTRRTVAAAALVAIGVIAPCAAWYVEGSRAAREQAARLEATAIGQSLDEARHLARQIALRLEALRQAESRRPFQEYAAPASPLAHGPVDPLVWAHFQVDEVGVLTLPTIGSDAPADSSAVDAVQRAILQDLECADVEHLGPRPESAGASGEPGAPLRLAAAGAPGAAGKDVVTVGPFSWHRTTVGGGPSLVALREVTTVPAVLTQGFVVPVERLAPLLASAVHPATMRPGPPETGTEVLLPLDGDAWTVAVDASAAVRTARSEGERILARFQRTFAVGALAAALAGLAVVGMVAHTERLARERARFAASAAHELRTPLASLRLLGELLVGADADDERRRRWARQVASEAERLGRVVTNVLGWARLERRAGVREPGDGDLAGAVRAAVERVRPGLEAAGARVELAADGPVPARFDAEAVERIVQNLLDNAEKFSREAADRSIRVDVRLERGEPLLAVVDRGPGVPPAVRRRLFRPILRHPAAGPATGLGIGLALVRDLAAAQGATVEHRVPDDGRGTEFRVRFAPAASEAPAPAGGRASARRA